MRRLAILFATLGGLCTPSLAAAQGALPTLPWERYQLPNGLDVVLAPDSAASEVSVEMWVRVGARHEWPGRFGLAHFFEHAMPFGQGMLRTPTGRAVYDSLRTNSNALTRFDYTRYYTQTKAAGLELFLLAASERLGADPTLELTAERVDAHRRNVTAEIERQASGIWGWPIKLALHAGTFGPHHPYGHHVYGSETETRQTSADDMLRWFRAHIRPEYTTLIVVGGFDAAGAREAIDRMFGPIPGGARPPRAAPVVPEVEPAVARLAIPADRSHVFLSWAVPPWDSEAHAPLDLLARVLDARLTASRPPSVAEAGAGTELWELAGRFGARARFADPGDSTAVTAWLSEEAARLAADGVTEMELAAARQAEIAEVREQMDSLGWQGSRSELLGEGVIYADDPDAYRRELERQAQVTPEAAARVARRWLGSPAVTLTVIGTGAE